MDRKRGKLTEPSCTILTLLDDLKYWKIDNYYESKEYTYKLR